MKISLLPAVALIVTLVLSPAAPTLADDQMKIEHNQGCNVSLGARLAAALIGASFTCNDKRPPCDMDRIISMATAKKNEEDKANPNDRLILDQALQIAGLLSNCEGRTQYEQTIWVAEGGNFADATAAAFNLNRRADAINYGKVALGYYHDALAVKGLDDKSREATLKQQKDFQAYLKTNRLQ